MRILVTRPEPDASRTAHKLFLIGHEALVDPLLLIQAVDFQLPPSPVSAVVATSASAMRIAKDDARLQPLRALPLYAVGPQTGEAGREAGFTRLIVATGDVANLAALMADELKSGTRLLYLAGADRARNLAELVASAGIEVETLVVYEARAAKHLAATTRAALVDGTLAGVLHYSARSASTFVGLSQQAGLADAIRKLRHFCLSDAAAAPVLQAGALAEIAGNPDETALFELLNR